MKPNSKSKMSQRPKDTVPRDQSHSLSNIHATRQKPVDRQQLDPVCSLLKCKLQQMNLPAAHIEPLFFEPYVPEQEVSILQLKSKFEKLGVDEKKSQLLARYLVEPQNQVEVIYNENAKATQQEVIEILNETIGHYFLYVDQEDKADDKKTAHKDMLTRMFVDNFGRQRSNLIDEFNDMDFETQGVLKLEEVKYAIVTCDEDVDPKVLDYMIYYVFTRS